MAILFILFTQALRAENPVPRIDWEKLAKLCETNWDQYLDQLSALDNQQIAPWARELAKPQNSRDFELLWGADNDVVVLVAMTWPELLPKRSEETANLKPCAEQHRNLRGQVLQDPKLSAREKTKKLNLFVRCIKDQYFGKVPNPMRQLLKCYQNRLPIKSKK